MPDALNYREGPHPGRPFKCLMHQSTEQEPSQGVPLYVPKAWNNREGAQAMEPSKCLNGWSNRERLAKEAS